MIVTDEFVFLHLEKCGGNFIKKWLKEAFNYEKVAGREHRGLVKKPQGKLVIGGIRNPFEWYVSCYHYMVDRGGINEPRYREHFRNGPTFEDFMDSCFYGDDFIDDYNDLVPYRHMQRLGVGYMTYEFLKILGGVTVSDFIKINHTPDIMNYSMVDEFYRTESLREDVERIFREHFRIEQEKVTQLYNIKRTHVTKKDKSYKEYYNDEYRELIEEREGQILNHFGYNYEDLK